MATSYWRPLSRPDQCRGWTTVDQGERSTGRCVGPDMIRLSPNTNEPVEVPCLHSIRLSTQSVTGVMAYSEGIYDDVNKALLGALFTGKQKTSRDVQGLVHVVVDRKRTR